MHFGKWISLSAVSVVFKIAVFLVIGKALAIFAGPTGLAFFGQAQSFVTLIITFSTGITATALVHYSSQRRDQRQFLGQIFASSLLVNILIASISLIVSLVFSDAISQKLFSNRESGRLIGLLALSGLAAAYYFCIQSMLNGLQKLKPYILFNIFSNIALLVCVLAFTLTTSVPWLAIGLPVSHAAMALIAWYMGRDLPFSVTRPNWPVFFKIHLRRFAPFALMALATSISGPLTQLLLRSALSDKFSWHETGFWQAVLRLSDGYLLVVTTALSAYYLPRFSSAEGARSLRQELVRYYKLVVPAVVAGSIVLYAARDVVIGIVFDRSFLPAGDLYGAQLLGDSFKLIGWIFTYLQISRRQWKIFTCIEIGFGILYYLLAVTMIDAIGIGGITNAYATTAFIYMCVNIAYYKASTPSKSVHYEN